MSQAFTFPPPPPPPPPPKPVQNSYGYQQNGTRGGPRGRGGTHFSQHTGRGRGQPPRGGQRGTFGNRSNFAYSVNGGAYSSKPATYNSPAHDSSARLNASQKRDHSTAFSPSSEHVAKNNRPRAPPPTPSFGADLERLIQKGQPAEPSARHANKANMLGLTPAARDSDSEDDAEEEATLAGSTKNNNLLEFEYNGQTSTLNTPEEIAAWIAERRKKWPTQEKREVARKDAEEKRKKWETEKAARSEAARAAAKARHEERQKQKHEREKSQVRQRLLKEHIEKSKAPAGLPENRPAAQLKAEKLRRRAEIIAQQLKTAEAALDKQDTFADGGGPEGDDLDTLLAKVDSAAAVQLVRGRSVAMSDRSSDASNESSADPCADVAEDTSTSGSSDSDLGSDSDSAPEETTSKRDGPERVLPPARKGASGLKAITDNRPLCKSFSETSRCKFGRRCRYKHERPTKKNGSTSDNRRKGLYQVMVEKELEEERKQALRAIIALGDAGVL